MAATTPNNDRSRIEVRRSTQNANKTIIAWPQQNDRNLARYETLWEKLAAFRNNCIDFSDWFRHHIVPLKLRTTGGGDRSPRLVGAIDWVIVISSDFLSDSFTGKETDIMKLEADMSSAENDALSRLRDALSELRDANLVASSWFDQETVRNPKKLLTDCRQKMSLIVNNLRELLIELKEAPAYEQLRKRHSNLPIS